MHVIGLDIGTTGCKAIVFDLLGDIKGDSFHEYDIICEKPGYAEQDPELVWQITKNVLRQAVYKSNTKDIKALSISVQGDAVIPVDKNIKALHHSLLGMDYRTVKQAQDFAQQFGDRALFNRTGMRPHPMNSLTKIIWFKENRPDIYERTFKFMTYGDFILSKLGAEPVMDYTMASRTMAFDIKTKTWSKDILKVIGLEEDLLSRPVPSGEVVGTIYNHLAAELGIPKDTVLVTGGHDQTCAALGAGVVKENIAIDSHGTAEVLSTAFHKPMLNDFMYNSYYPCYSHVKKDMYFTFALNHIGGLLFKWYRDNLGYAEVSEAEKLGINPYELMISKTSKGPSSIMVLPHFNGSGTPWCDLESKGAIVGLSMSTTRHDMVKAILDSLTYELRINMETMKNAGIMINELRCVGGAAKSPAWLQIKADITGCTVSTLRIREAACLGAGILASTAVGGYRSLEEGVFQTVNIEKVFEPLSNISKSYNDQYEIYRELYGTLKEINKKL